MQKRVSLNLASVAVKLQEQTEGRKIRIYPGKMRPDCVSICRSDGSGEGTGVIHPNIQRGPYGVRDRHTGTLSGLLITDCAKG